MIRNLAISGKLLKKSKEFWFSGISYKKLFSLPIILYLLLTRGRIEPFSTGCMLIKKNSIYILLSKCGTTTITNEIMRTKKYKILNKKEFEHYKNRKFIFTFVRNPYGRLLSTYIDKVKFQAKTRDTKDYSLTGLISNLDLRNISFEDFVKAVCKIPDKSSDPHFVSMSYILDNLKTKVDFMGKMENFEKDWNGINELIGLNPADKLPTKNKGRYDKNTKKYYTSELKKLVYERYKEDFLRYGYKK